MFRSVVLVLGLFVLSVGNVWCVSIPHSHQVTHSHGSYASHIHILNHEHDGTGFDWDEEFNTENIDCSSHPTGFSRNCIGNDVVMAHQSSASDFTTESNHHSEVGHYGSRSGDPWRARNAPVTDAEKRAAGTTIPSSDPVEHTHTYGNTMITHTHDPIEHDPNFVPSPPTPPPPPISHSHSRRHYHGNHGPHNHFANHEHAYGDKSHSHSWDGHSNRHSIAVELALEPGLEMIHTETPDNVHQRTPPPPSNDFESSPQGRSDESQVIFLPPQLNTDGGSSDLPEDVDRDGDVDNDDLTAIAMKFGSTSTDDLERYDLDGDGDIDTDDFTQVQSKLGSTVNSAPAASLALHLKHIKGLHIADTDFHQVIQLLERRSPEPVPKETVLLTNYPNPFNPETWIPYRLAKAANVTLTIYAISGEVVRSLALGHQPAGSYVNRGRAAYWDGKDAFGDPVTSGIYFYTLSTDHFSATRKMLIAK